MTTRRFDAVLHRALLRRGMGTRALAAAIGVSAPAVRYWRRGEYLPSMEMAERLADVLGEPAILDAVRAARTGTCRLCGRGRLIRISSRRYYCSDRCRRLAEKGVTPKVPDERDVAIAHFCAQCEPEGLCRDIDCPLRPVSPLPFARMSGVVA